MGVRAVIFDLDGTLVDSGPDIAAAINHVLGKWGREPLPEDQVRAFTGLGAEQLVRRAFAAAGEELEGQRLEEAKSAYLERYGEHPVERSTLFHDAAAGLAALKERGLAVAVCTNKETELSWVVLRGLGIERWVDVVVGADTAPRRKPDPEHLRAALKAVGSQVGEAVYVGDNDVDVETAAAAGVRCLIVDWGSVDAGADGQCMRLHRFAELVELLDAQPGPAGSEH